ncbi:MAG: hypothetical protein NTZ05_12945 [Chloroflexi bacterium]|nr:hypothetical protein [Chloroflexota bacterium]
MRRADAGSTAGVFPAATARQTASGVSAAASSATSLTAAPDVGNERPAVRSGNRSRHQALPKRGGEWPTGPT